MNNPDLPGNNENKTSTSLPETIPWRDYSTWQEVWSFFEHSCRDKARLAPCEKLVHAIASKIERVDDLFTAVCPRTCPRCTDSCCTRATVWYDFRDLLFQYLLLGELPAHQIVRLRGRGCPYLTARGCALARIHRPFICTWYVCAAQKEEIGNIASGKGAADILELLRQIQSQRLLLEKLFLQAVAL